MEEIKFSNLDKPSNKKWKAVADFFLYTLPLYLVAIMAAPLDENLKLWLTFGITILSISLKGFTKFTAETK
jgi:predicted phosphoadenosine phosphosulfate sulfurtransferase